MSKHGWGRALRHALARRQLQHTMRQYLIQEHRAGRLIRLVRRY